jgi:Ala-tRNA(Pro) deacylase
MTRDDVLRHLDELGVPYTMITHPPVMTVQDAESHWAALPAIHTKNLFLKDAGGALWLVSAPTTRQIDLKALPKLIGAKRLSFGSADLLIATLGTRPGSVSPLSMVNAAPGSVTLILDATLGEAPAIGMHPLDNTATIAMGYAELVRVLAAFGHGGRLVALGL